MYAMWSLVRSLFSSQHSHAVFCQPLLSDDEINTLRIRAERVQCDDVTPHALTSAQSSGGLASQSLGSGMDYAESRVYQQGDDPRYIDWRVSARSQETFVKSYYVESRPSLCILLDKRQSMSFGTRRRLKVAQALRTAIMLVYAAEFHQLDVKVLVINDEIEWLEGMSSAALIALINTPCEPIKNKQEQCLDVSLAEIKVHISKGSLVYLLSDFPNLTQADLNELQHMKNLYYLSAIHVLDQAEISLPRIGKVRLQQMGGVQSYQIQTQNKKEYEAFIKYAEAQVSLKKKYFAKLGIAYIRLWTDDDNIDEAVSLPLGKTL